MERNVGEPWVDQWITEEQRDLVEKLSRYNYDAARSYKGALYAYHSKDNPDRVSHFAYGLRDVIDILAKEGKDKARSKHDKAKQNSGKNRYWGKKKRIMGLTGTFDPLTKQQYEYDAEYQTLAKIYGELSNIGHQKTRIKTEDMDSVLERVEKILHVLARYQTEINDEVKLIISQNPSVDGAKRLMRMQTNGATHIRITRALTPPWLHHMAEEGYFRDPKDGVYWISQKYLVRCAKSDPEEVAKVIMSSYSVEALEKDLPVYIDILRCIPNLTPEHAAEVVRHMLDNGWYRLFWVDEGPYIKVAGYLYLEGRYEIAAEMLRRAFAVPTPDPGGPGMPDIEPAWRGMDELVKDILEKAGEVDLIPMLGALADLLDQAIKAESGGVDGVSDAESSMYTRRPTIEDSGENWLDDLVSSFVSHARDCLLAIGMKDAENLERAMDIIRDRKNLVWRRMEMFVYGSFPDRFDKEAEAYAVRYMGDSYTGHENQVMLGRRFAGMPARAKKEVLARLDRGFGAEKFARIRGQIGEERAGIIQDKWMLRYLETLKKDLDAEHRETYMRLVEKYGRIKNPERRFADHDESLPEERTIRTRFDSLDHAFGIMAGYAPDARTLPDYAIRAFTDIVTRHPLEASRRALRLEGAHPDVRGGFFRGLDNAVLNNARIDWGSIMQLMRDVGSKLSREGTGEEAARMICMMLRDSFSRQKPDIAYREPLWEVVKLMAGAATTRHDAYRKGFEERGDGHNISINNFGGISFHALILYAVWAARKDGKNSLDPGVREIIDGYIGDREIHTVSRSSALGVYLLSLRDLDREWAMGLARKIRESGTVGAFWEGYVRWNRPYEDVFSDLRDLYGQFLNGDRSPKIRKTEMFKSTLDHVLSVYLYGDGAGDMFRSFLRTVDKAAPEEMVDHCIFRVGMVVRGEYGDPGFDPARLEPLWSHPVFSARALTGWFVGSKIDRKTSIAMYSRHVAGYTGRVAISHDLMEELESYAPEFPDEVFGCLDRLVVSALSEYVPDTVKKVIDALERAGKDCRMIKEKIKSRAY